ncbi:MAG: hypothetical protein IPN76_22095 [Saprospiraceae bacterium]|jgi:hypothetical protein|nr:hypothetical protein [Saprospiraceae bacterium]
MIKEHYVLRNSPDLLKYRFKSVGIQGEIDKFIIFEDMDDGTYNLAFGDIIDGKTVDEVVSNNFDYVKTISTVAKAVSIFFKEYPLAVLKIEAIDERRLRFYNRIFKRRHREIEIDYVLEGVNGDEKERYHPDGFYLKFEIKRKIF